MTEFVAYYRVSTKRQGQSGLGIEAQQEAVREYIEQAGGELVGAYTEVESGRKKDRPELSKALAHARCNKAVLVIARLDRLTRNAHFLRDLEESGVQFIAVDNPNVNKVTIRVLAAIAEDEAEKISARTKAALSAAKARGVKLGSHRPGHWEGREDARLRGLAKGRKKAAVVLSAQAARAYDHVTPIVRELHDAGESLRGIARVLNERGFKTRRGKEWGPVQVRAVLSMLQVDRALSRARR